MSEDNERLNLIARMYAAHMQSNQRTNWGYRAAFLAFSLLLLSALVVMLLEWVQPSHNIFAMIGLTALLFFFSFFIANGAFGARKE